MTLEVEGLSFSYGEVENLSGISLQVDGGEVLGIVGPNGSGKTTLIRCISRILVPDSGTVLLDGRDVSGMSRTDIAKEIGFVPQNSVSDQMPPSVYEVVLMGRLPYITWNYSDQDREIAWKAMEEMDVSDLASRPFNRLSSGQTQRVLIARAITQGAKLIMLDEPTSNLDVRYQIEVLETIRSTVKRKGISACLIIHDLDLAMRFCDRVLLMNSGRVVALGPTTEVLTPENIESVFGIRTAINTEYGRARIIVLDRDPAASFRSILRHIPASWTIRSSQLPI
jgi:iron complex transport system ATP-binding protein